jgi:xanthine dehydrogenase accessory factor
MVALSEAVYERYFTVEDLTGVLVHSQNEIHTAWENNNIPVIIDREGKMIDRIKPSIVVDAILAKKNLGTNKKMAPITIGLGPGFYASVDVDIVVETKRGHHLGSLIFHGKALNNTGVPGDIGGVSRERVIYSPDSGIINNLKMIGDCVEKGDRLATIADQEVVCPISGLIRGIIKDKTHVTKGLKIADIDPRKLEKKNCYQVSDKARCIGGAVLEAILMLKRRIR